MRAILASLFFSKDGIFSFELLDNIKQLETLQTLNFIKKENNSDYLKLSDLKVLSKYFLRIQDEIIKGIKNSNSCFLKTHSAFLKYYGNNFTDEEKTLGFIHIVRDPRDIAVSLSNYMNIGIDESIKFMLNKNAALQYTGVDKKDTQIKPPIMIGSWNIHFNSWTFLNVPKLLIRYEDLISNKEKIIKQIINFFEKNYNMKFNNFDNKIKNILISTEFNTLKKNEKKFGFKESNKDQSFFKSGKSKQWEKKLTSSQINLIEVSFKEEMKKLDYL